MPTYSFMQADLSKAEFELLPECARDFLVNGGLAANDISLFKRLIIQHPSDASASDVVTSFALVHFMILARVLATRVLEFQRLAKRSAESFAKAGLFDLSLRLAAHANALKDDLHPKMNDLRNRATGHYSVNYIGEALEAMPTDHRLKLYAGSEAGNSLVAFSEEIALRSHLAMTGETDERIKALLKWTVDHAGASLEVYYGLAATLFQRYLPHTVQPSVTVEVEDEFSGPANRRSPVIISVTDAERKEFQG